VNRAHNRESDVSPFQGFGFAGGRNPGLTPWAKMCCPFGANGGDALGASVLDRVTKKVIHGPVVAVAFTVAVPATGIGPEFRVKPRRCMSQPAGEKPLVGALDCSFTRFCTRWS
jgi:hypothetical protein